MSSTVNRRARVLRVIRYRYISVRLWRRQGLFWAGAILVAAIAIVFAAGADDAGRLFRWMTAGRPWLPFILAPAGLAISLLLTQRVFPGAQGSGIPQTIAALHLHDATRVDRILSLRVAAGKVVLTLLALGCGASIGREGPTVQIGAAVMHALGRAARMPSVELQRALVLAGGAAGVGAAFNTPLAGIVFAIEELSHSFEARTSGTVFTAVILAGATTLGLLGNYTYFGHTSADLPFGVAWVAVPLCSLVGGGLGGVFSAVLIHAARGFRGRAGLLVRRRPIAYAAACGLALAAFGALSGGQTYGTGYAQARALVAGQSNLPAQFFALKFLATVVSYVSGIPGGIFAPSLAVGAGLGRTIAHWLPAAPAGSVVLLGMVAYFSGVVQAPITAAVIVMEMTDNQDMMIPLMTTSLLATGVSRLVCRRPLYGTLARRFLATQVRAGETVSGLMVDEAVD
jgi:H+/Cl- antiporter ClcA